jgi:hypothetical protein
MKSQKTAYEENSHFMSNRNPGHVGRRRARTFVWTTLLWLAGLLAVPGVSFAQSPLTDDADSHKGNTANLTLTNDSSVYLKFKLTATLPTNTPGASVAKATIKLYLGAVKSPGTLDVYQLVSDWSEKTIASAPPILGNLLQAGVPVQSDQEGKFLVIDVTAAVRQWLGTDGSGSGGAPNDGVALVARDAVSLTFDSKENSQTSHEAQLNIQMEDSDSGGTVTSVSANPPLSVTNPTTTPNISLGIVPTVNGGTGLTSPGASGNFLRSGGNVWKSAPLTAADIPPGSAQYIQNSTIPQAAANFNIGGAGKAGIFDAATQFNLGGNRVLSQPGTNNLFAGVGAGAANAGQGNSFFGDSAGLANTTGDFSSFFGSGAGRANSGGSNNSFFGSDAGLANTTGFQNSFFGREAGANNTTGSFNSFFGRSTGFHNTTGQTNTFFGQDSGLQNTTGSRNAFFGNSSGQENQTGGDNAFFGPFAGSRNTTGSSNAFLGTFAGDLNTTGSNNTIIGVSANVSANNLNFASAIGSGAIVSTSNTVVLGRSADTVQVPGAFVTVGNIVVGSPGQGVILRSPNGATCRLLSIDNAGNLALVAVACP